MTALSHMPLADATALNYTTPTIVIVLAIVFLNERLTLPRMAFVVAGLAGMLMIVQPGAELFQGTSLFALGSALCYAIYQITTRMLAGEDPRVSLFYPALVGTLLMTLVWPWFGSRIDVTWTDVALLAGIGVLGTIGHFLLILAFQRAPASALTPFTYVQVVFATLIGWLVYDDFPDALDAGRHGAHRRQRIAAHLARTPARADRCARADGRRLNRSQQGGNTWTSHASDSSASASWATASRRISSPKGFPLTVRVNRNRAPLEDLLAAGAKEVKTNADVARNSDIVFLCVTGAPQVEEIINGKDGIAGAARKGLVVIDTSTSEPATTAKMREALAEKGVRFVDAPLARTPVEAELGKLNIMVGADDATFAELKPVLAAFCENIIHAGPAGHGIVLKLINNFLAMSIANASAEACAAAAKSGLSIRKLHEVVSAGAVNSGIFQMLVGKMLDGDLSGLKFTLVNAMKDLRYYTHMAESLPVSAIMGEAVHQSLVNANLLGFGDKYVASLLEAQEKLNGVKIVPRG